MESEMRIKDIENNNLSKLKDGESPKKHEILFSDECSSLYSSSRPEAKYEFDYEINSVHFGEEKGVEYMLYKEDNKLLDKYIKIDPSTQLYDSINVPYTGDENIINPSSIVNKFQANIFKKKVSKKKRRIQTDEFDLDMSYITERVIGMGFPATGWQTFYRNSLKDLKSFLDKYHGEYKIYNLCIEKDRIYPKDYWEGKKVGLFPFNDHSPCPIKLILDFCIDLCIYLTAYPKGVAAIHCKAGKGRTGVMIVCYLLFSELFQTSEEALKHYANQRTINNKGVTIASQKKYIKYFEAYLSANFERPFMKCIPKIIKYELDKGYKNILMNYNIDMSYFTSINGFKLKKCIIGPFSEEVDFEYDFSAITRKKLKFLKNKVEKQKNDEYFYYQINIDSNDVINYDLKLLIKGKKLNFYSWFNLWFNTFEIVSNYVKNNNYFEDEKNEEIKDTSINEALAKVNTGETGLNEGKSQNILSTIIHQTTLKEVGKKNLSRAFHKIIENYTKRKKRKSAINSLKNNKDLNIILNDIDELAKEKGVELLDRENLEFIVEKSELDKLKTTYVDEFYVKFIYELLK